ncbi:hypothetical protein KIPB_012326, partial [Kipferlia bialata]
TATWQILDIPAYGREIAVGGKIVTGRVKRRLPFILGDSVVFFFDHETSPALHVVVYSDRQGWRIDSGEQWNVPLGFSSYCNLPVGTSTLCLGYEALIPFGQNGCHWRYSGIGWFDGVAGHFVHCCKIGFWIISATQVAQDTFIVLIDRIDGKYRTESYVMYLDLEMLLESLSRSETTPPLSPGERGGVVP